MQDTHCTMKNTWRQTDLFKVRTDLRQPFRNVWGFFVRLVLSARCFYMPVNQVLWNECCGGHRSILGLVNHTCECFTLYHPQHSHTNHECFILSMLFFLRSKKLTFEMHFKERTWQSSRHATYLTVWTVLSCPIKMWLWNSRVLVSAHYIVHNRFFFNEIKWNCIERYIF